MARGGGWRAVHGISQSLFRRLQWFLPGPDDRALAADPAWDRHRIALPSREPIVAGILGHDFLGPPLHCWQSCWARRWATWSRRTTRYYGIFFHAVVYGFPSGRAARHIRLVHHARGVFTLAVLAGHGALYLVWKTTGPVQVRSAAWARKIWHAVLPLWVLVTACYRLIQPESLHKPPHSSHVLGLCCVDAGRTVRSTSLLEPKARAAGVPVVECVPPGPFGGHDGGHYPVWLRSTLDPAHSLTAANSAAQSYALQVALAWWSIGIALAGRIFCVPVPFHSRQGRLQCGGACY